VVDKISLKDLDKWSKSEGGGLIFRFSHANFKTVAYFLHEFTIDGEDPMNRIGAFRLGNLLVVGRRWFLEDIWKGLGLPG
jgi:hypothetical protein